MLEALQTTGTAGSEGQQEGRHHQHGHEVVGSALVGGPGSTMNPHGSKSHEDDHHCQLASSSQPGMHPPQPPTESRANNMNQTDLGRPRGRQALTRSPVHRSVEHEHGQMQGETVCQAAGLSSPAGHAPEQRIPFVGQQRQRQDLQHDACVIIKWPAEQGVCMRRMGCDENGMLLEGQCRCGP